LHAHHSTVHFAQILCCRLGLLLYGQRHRGQVVTLCFSEANSRRCACEQRSAARAIRTCRLGLLSRRYWWCGSYSFSDQSGAYNPTPRRRWKRSMKGVMRFKVVKDKEPNMTPKTTTPRHLKAQKQNGYRGQNTSSVHGRELHGSRRAQPLALLVIRSKLRTGRYNARTYIARTGQGNRPKDGTNRVHETTHARSGKQRWEPPRRKIVEVTSTFAIAVFFVGSPLRSMST